MTIAFFLRPKRPFPKDWFLSLTKEGKLLTPENSSLKEAIA